MDLPFVSEVALVLPEATSPGEWGDLLSPYGDRLICTVGGARRQDSVAAGLAVLRWPYDVALVHDAARPFVKGENVARLAQATLFSGGGLLAMRSADTVKRAMSGPGCPCVAETLDRETIWLAQTPQAIRADLVPRAIEAFRDPANTVTDEASLLEQWGVPVTLVESSSLNFKVTHPEDFAKAEAILAWRI
jgi:2-C-methyl-D-erythritol 4-phosphate cytidylyltransferase